jgi:hypothetical protein
MIRDKFIWFVNTVNPSIIMPFGDHFFLMTLTNCDLNLYSHILYKPLQDSDYMKFF